MNKLLIWGTGHIESLLSKEQLNGEVIGYIETVKLRDSYNELPVYSPDDLVMNYDYIIVANTYANDIYNICIEKNIDTQKMIFMSLAKHQVGIDRIDIIENVLGKSNLNLYYANVERIPETSYEHDIQEYENKNKRKNFSICNGTKWPVLTDKYMNAGLVTNYFLQDLWAARLINKYMPQSHFDIGSRVDGFIAHILAMHIPVTLIDIRKFPYEVEGLDTIIDDATSLSQIDDNSIVSMSALCSLEHFGLGRYGDPIDPEACFKCFENIQHKIKKGGKLYISVPVGRERVEFNAHRVFYPQTVIECFNQLKLLEFSCVADGKIEYDVDIHKYGNDVHNGEYRYGLFWFEK